MVVPQQRRLSLFDDADIQEMSTLNRPMKKRVKVAALPTNQPRRLSLKDAADILQVGLPDEKKMSDHRQTHEVFVELDELEVHDNHLIWKERYL